VLTALRVAIPIGSRVCARHVNVVRVPSSTSGRTRRELKLCSTDRRLHYSRGLKANRPSRAAVEAQRRQQIAPSAMAPRSPALSAGTRSPWFQPVRATEMPASDHLELVLERLEEAESLNASLQEYIAQLEFRNNELQEQLDAAHGLRSEVDLLRHAAGQFRIESLAAQDGAVSCLTGVPSYADFVAFCRSLPIPTTWFRRGRLDVINVVAAALIHIRTGRTFDDLACTFFGNTRNHAWRNTAVNQVLT